jgi:hypothetical protein
MNFWVIQKLEKDADRWYQLQSVKKIFKWSLMLNRNV